MVAPDSHTDSYTVAMLFGNPFPDLKNDDAIDTHEPDSQLEIRRLLIIAAVQPASISRIQPPNSHERARVPFAMAHQAHQRERVDALVFTFRPLDIVEEVRVPPAEVDQTETSPQTVLPPSNQAVPQDQATEEDTGETSCVFV